MNKLPTKQENPEGFHHRYDITKVDGSPLDEGAEYIVLRVDRNGKDQIHAEAGRKAALTYAHILKQQNHLTQVADDIIARYSESGF